MIHLFDDAILRNENPDLLGDSTGHTAAMNDQNNQNRGLWYKVVISFLWQTITFIWL